MDRWCNVGPPANLVPRHLLLARQLLLVKLVLPACYRAAVRHAVLDHPLGRPRVPSTGPSRQRTPCPLVRGHGVHLGCTPPPGVRPQAAHSAFRAPEGCRGPLTRRVFLRNATPLDPRAARGHGAHVPVVPVASLSTSGSHKALKPLHLLVPMRKRRRAAHQAARGCRDGVLAPACGPRSPALCPGLLWEDQVRTPLPCIALPAPHSQEGRRA